MMASARGTPGGSAAGSTAPQPAHTPLYSRYSLTSGRIGGMSNTWCRSGLPRTLTVPPQVHTGGGTQSCTRWTSDSGSRARNAPGWPFCAPRLRALALRCARLPRPGPSEDGGLDELRESSARRSSRMMTLSRSEASSPASASITAWHMYATLLDEERYLCSWRTMYRVLAENQPVRERRNQLQHPSYAKPELLATQPNRLWSWDITKLRGPRTWTSYSLYV